MKQWCRYVSPCLYVVKSGRYYKIGITTYTCNGKIRARLSQLQTSNPSPIELEFFIITDFAKKWESFFHELFYEYRVSGEWFDLEESQLDWMMNWLGKRTVFDRARHIDQKLRYQHIRDCNWGSFAYFNAGPEHQDLLSLTDGRVVRIRQQNENSSNIRHP